MLEAPDPLREACALRTSAGQCGAQRESSVKTSKKTSPVILAIDCLLERGAAAPGPRTLAGRPRHTTAYSARRSLSRQRETVSAPRST